MLRNPAEKYRPFPAVRLSGRRWPARTLERAPVWMSTDLRDGNQALIEPMSGAQKLEFFEKLVAIGFREIEVGFPAASQTDFDFVRRLIVEKCIPDDVTIEVLTPSREELIARTFDALEGAPRAIVHLYNAVCPSFRSIVFGQSKDEVKALAVDGARMIRAQADARPRTRFTFQYSPETFSMTELHFAREVCDAVAHTWRPTREHRMIVNLPATVEVAMPNVYADQIEWMSRHLAYRDCIVLSVHPHNDRGTAVAAAELALLAGAERVEGCLFGNGERTGNVDLVTLAMNLYTQGIDPGLDFSDIDAVRRLVERCNQIPVHPRHPYAGDFVFTAFSGSHQDAIRKGFAQQRADARWDVPYLPVDPADLGRGYDAVIRVNSQSGKAGATYLLEHGMGFTPPRRVQIEFSHAVQAAADASGAELTGEAICALFAREYFETAGPAARAGAPCRLYWEGREVGGTAGLVAAVGAGLPVLPVSSASPALCAPSLAWPVSAASDVRGVRDTRGVQDVQDAWNAQGMQDVPAARDSQGMRDVPAARDSQGSRDVPDTRDLRGAPDAPGAQNSPDAPGDVSETARTWVDALADALSAAAGETIAITSFEHARTGRGEIVAFVGCRVGNQPVRYGAGRAGDVATATVDALVSGVNRAAWPRGQRAGQREAA